MIRMFHNPRCSKSRATLGLLEERGVEPEIVEYLTQPPSEAELRDVIGMLGVEPRALLRTNEAPYRDLGLTDADDDTLIRAMVEHPVLIQRPIVIANGKAAIGRPPEAVLDIL